MKIKVKYFGILAEKTQCENQQIKVDVAMRLDEFHHVLLQHHPVLRSSDYILSYNQKISEGTEVLEEGDEIALLPPFAGG